MSEGKAAEPQEQQTAQDPGEVQAVGDQEQGKQEQGKKTKVEEKKKKLWKKPKAFVVPLKNQEKYKDILLCPRRKRRGKDLQGGGHLPPKKAGDSEVHGNDANSSFGRCHRGLLPDIVSSASAPDDVSAFQRKMRDQSETQARQILQKNLEALKKQQERRAETESNVDSEEEDAEDAEADAIAAEKHEIWVNWRKQKDKQLREKKKEKQRFMKKVNAETQEFQGKLKEKAMQRKTFHKESKQSMVNQTVLAKEQHMLAKRIDTAIAQVKHSPYTLPLPRLSEARAEYYKQRDEAEAQAKLAKMSDKETRTTRRQERKRAQEREEQDHQEQQAEAKAEAEAFMEQLAEKQRKKAEKKAEKSAVMFTQQVQEKASTESKQWEAEAQKRKARLSVRKAHITEKFEKHDGESDWQPGDDATDLKSSFADEQRANAMAEKLGLQVPSLL
jgi:hypothetical protein